MLIRTDVVLTSERVDELMPLLKAGSEKAAEELILGYVRYVRTILPNVPNYTAGTPEHDALASVWEQRCQKIHAAQTKIELPDKPEASGGLKRGTAVAEFGITRVDSKPKPFHETETSTEFQRGD